MSDMLEIEAAKIAQQKGNAGEKKFAADDDHRPHQDRLRTEGKWSARHEGGAAHALDDSSQKKLDKVRDANPEDFAANTIRCRSARTRTQPHCSSVTPKAATIPS